MIHDYESSIWVSNTMSSPLSRILVFSSSTFLLLFAILANLCLSFFMGTGRSVRITLPLPARLNAYLWLHNIRIAWLLAWALYVLRQQIGNLCPFTNWLFVFCYALCSDYHRYIAPYCRTIFLFSLPRPHGISSYILCNASQVLVIFYLVPLFCHLVVLCFSTQFIFEFIYLCTMEL